MLYQPGQYAAIGLRDRARPTVMRCFSVTTSPTNQQVLQFSMRIKGKFTSALERLKPGDKVVVRGPFGGFVFVPMIHQDVVLMAGGIGVAPFISMLRYAQDLNLPNKMHLIYSCRDQSEMAFKDELQSIARKNPNIRVTFIMGDGNVTGLSNQALSGYADAQNLSTLNLNYLSQTFFVCGPPPYMNAVIALLHKNGASEGQVLSEAFSQSSKRQTGKLRSWPFNMYALTGAALLVSGFFITVGDLYKTLPKLVQSASTTRSVANSTLPGSGNDISSNVNAVNPQIDTNTSQAPTTSSSNQSTSRSTQSPRTSTTTTVAPSPTTVTTPPARTTVS